MLKLVKSVSAVTRRHMSVAILPHQHYTSDDENLKAACKRIQSLSVEIDTSLIDKNTLARLNACADEFVVELLQNLADFDLKAKHMADILCTYEDWSVLTRSKLNEMQEMYRSLSLQKEVYLALMSKNALLAQANRQQLAARHRELQDFFTNKYLDRILVRSPRLLTDDFHYIKYKFIYMFSLMGVEQKDMCQSQAFDFSIGHIRERHLFLLRSSFYDKPNKKGLTKFENPRLYQMMDTSLPNYLRICARDAFTVHDYETFCEYLKQENFETELLGLKIGKSMQDELLKTIQEQRKYDKSTECD